MSPRSARPTALLLAFFLCYANFASAQKAAKSGGSSKSSGTQTTPSQAGGESPDSAPFSIETEMFTYKTVEQNSEIIACDIARYLGQGELAEAPSAPHAPCAIANPTRTAPGVILISDTSSLLSNFQLWRADLATMSGLAARANTVCVDNPAAQAAAGQEGQTSSQPVHIRSRSLTGAAESALKSTPPGEAASALQEALQLFSHDQSVTSVIGTVEDPALMNEVARQLRALNVQVLVPEFYNPNALGGIDYSSSPYLKALENLFDSYSKCDKAKGTYKEGSPEAADINSVNTVIDSFLKTTFAPPPPPSSSSGETPQNSANTQANANANANAISHFSAALSADEVAAKIGFGENGANGPNLTWQHILWLKALESGGSVTKEGNLFGTKVLFGGGAVDTYSLFRLDGELVCSGNVYNFQNPVKLKDLQKAFTAPPAQSAFKSTQLFSTCTPLPSASN